MNQQEAQKRINEVQEIYKEFLALQKKLELAQKDFEKSAELVTKMEEFYHGGEYLSLFDEIENGLEVNLKTAGEHSIMSEDALWNALVEYREFLWKQLRFAVEHLDRK